MSFSMKLTYGRNHLFYRDFHSLDFEQWIFLVIFSMSFHCLCSCKLKIRCTGVIKFKLDFFWENCLQKVLCTSIRMYPISLLFPLPTTCSLPSPRYDTSSHLQNRDILILFSFQILIKIFLKKENILCQQFGYSRIWFIQKKLDMFSFIYHKCYPQHSSKFIKRQFITNYGNVFNFMKEYYE